MIGGDRDHLFAAAKGEKNESLRADAIRQLGLVHAPDQLHQLYQSETSPNVKKDILQAFFLSGDAKFLAEVAQTDKDPEIRRTAIHNLGLIGNDDSRQALLNIYNKETDRENKETVLNSMPTLSSLSPAAKKIPNSRRPRFPSLLSCIPKRPATT